MYAGFDAFKQRLRYPKAQSTQIEFENPHGGGKLPPAEVVDCIPESVRAEAVVSAAFPGPLPPPTMYRGYNEVLPGSAERILRLAEKEQDRRIGWGKEKLGLASQRSRLGLWLGFVIAVFALVTSGLLATNGHDLVAGVVGCAGLAGAAAGLIHERRK